MGVEKRGGGREKTGGVKRRLLFCQALVYFPCAQTPTPHNPIYILYKQKACQQAHTYIHIPLLPCQWGTIKTHMENTQKCNCSYV